MNAFHRLVTEMAVRCHQLVPGRHVVAKPTHHPGFTLFSTAIRQMVARAISEAPSNQYFQPHRLRTKMRYRNQTFCKGRGRDRRESLRPARSAGFSEGHQAIGPGAQAGRDPRFRRRDPTTQGRTIHASERRHSAPFKRTLLLGSVASTSAYQSGLIPPLLE